MKTTTPRKNRSKPCCICRKRFIPSPRLGERQKTCGEQACRTERKRRVQARWSRKNADYWTERRLREQAARLATGDGRPADKPPPSGLNKLPSSYIRDEMGAPALAILAFLVRLQHRAAQVSIRRQALDFERKFNKYLHTPPQVPIRPEPPDIQGKLVGDAVGAAQVAIGDSNRRE